MYMAYTVKFVYIYIYIYTLYIYIKKSGMERFCEDS